jgi:hypothetical protein
MRDWTRREIYRRIEDLAALITAGEETDEDLQEFVDVIIDCEADEDDDEDLVSY